MLERLELENVGPAPDMALDLAPRLNLITGDNGLGKSFLLDVAWWALTRTWPRDLNAELASGYPARPSRKDRDAHIRFQVRTQTQQSKRYESKYSYQDQGWPGKKARPYIPGLVIYARADGGFSVWDPARNYWKSKGGVDVQDRLRGYVFSPRNLWTGLDARIDDRTTRVCRGLLDDWSGWIKEKGLNADLMVKVLSTLTVDREPVEIGPLLRLSIDDAQDIPSIKTPYSDAVPIVHASSGVRRIAGLAYMMAWSWTEHLRAAELLNVGHAKRIVLLFDEIEAHLHPKWQRAIVPACLKAANTLTGDNATEIQIIAATHSPLVLASVEPHFEEERDRLFHLDLDMDEGTVHLKPLPWAKQGDALNWLVSESFGLRQARSEEAEQVIEAAEAFMRRRRNDLPEDLQEENTIHQELLHVLAEHDPFWPRWIVSKEHRGSST